MKDLTLSGENRMTVKEVAEALSVHIDTIHSWIDKLYPEIKKNGVTTYLNEEQVTRIKQKIGTGRNDLEHLRNIPKVTTALERHLVIMQAMEWLREDADSLRAELAAAGPKLESHDALMRSENTMSITDAAKHFGLHPKTQVFPYLRANEYLTRTDLPAQAAIDAGYLVMRETKCADGEIRRAAAVEVRQLEIWRTRIVPQIRKWELKEARI